MREIIQIVITDLRKVGGAAGLSGIPSMPALPGISSTPGASATWIYSFVSLVVLLSLHLQRSTYGRALIAIRENELAAEMMGIRTARLETHGVDQRLHRWCTLWPLPALPWPLTSASCAAWSS